MHEVFISYKSEEYADAIWLEQVLKTNGISCWIAPESIPGGSNYGQEIPKAIENCKVFVLVLSNKAQKSMWISKEVNMALNFKKIIMPFMIEDCELVKEFNFYLSDVQRYSAYESKVNAVGQMIAEIKGILDTKADESSISVNKEAEKKVYNNEKEQDKTKPRHKYIIFMFIALSYLMCIPGGIIATVSYLIEQKKHKEHKLTKILCILSIIVGFIIKLFGGV